MRLKRHIFLIGFMGAGKSANADYLAKAAGARLMEMDREIVREQGMEISEIFARFGEDYFRGLETDLIRRQKDALPSVISCGGGAVLREENVRLMKETGTIVLLTATPETILNRVRDDEERPILNGHKDVEYIGALMEKRREKYENAADVRVATDGRAVAEICDEILKKAEQASRVSGLKNEEEVRMDLISEKFAKLGCDNAPGQEGRQGAAGIELRGEKLAGTPVDFSHGDVDAFPPIPGTLDTFIEGVHVGGKQAYTEYRGKQWIREDLAKKLGGFTGVPVDADRELILTPGTQGALFLALGATVARGDKVAIVEPDYFANRKLVEFFDGELVPIHMDYFGHHDCAGIDLDELERGFQNGVKLFLFSNPNNPTGVVYSHAEVSRIAELANRYGASVIADELYSRQVFDGRDYTHLRAQGMNRENLITIIGPSKTESLSGYRLGVAYGSARIIDRMEKLQAIVSLRAGGYSQAVFQNWFAEPEGWMKERIAAHQAIRDDLVALLTAVEGVHVRPTEAGSYLFPQLPPLDVSIHEFVKALRLQADVIVTPGTEFGPQFTDSFRINFSQDHGAAVEAIKRTITMIGRYRK